MTGRKLAREREQKMGADSMAKANTGSGKENEPRSPRTLVVKMAPGEEQELAMPRTVLNPALSGAVVTNALRMSGLGDLDMQATVEELEKQAGLVSGSNLERCEAMLISQAHSLDAIFSRLAVRASSNVAEYPQAMEIYLRLALKAQSQCRATLETLAAVKNPPVVYAKQANIANGPQQVNNGTAAPSAPTEPAPSRARKNGKEPIKLLEAGKDG